jgi:hypothetical protein
MAALLSACGGSVGPENVYIADENDNGQTVTMGAGDALQISLPENRSTGYVWSIAPTTGGVAADRRADLRHRGAAARRERAGDVHLRLSAQARYRYNSSTPARRGSQMEAAETCLLVCGLGCWFGRPPG